MNLLTCNVSDNTALAHLNPAAGEGSIIQPADVEVAASLGVFPYRTNTAAHLFSICTLLTLSSVLITRPLSFRGILMSRLIIFLCNVKDAFYHLNI